MNGSLAPELERSVLAKVESDRHNPASEVFCAAPPFSACARQTSGSRR